MAHVRPFASNGVASTKVIVRDLNYYRNLCTNSNLGGKTVVNVFILHITNGRILVSLNINILK